MVQSPSTECRVYFRYAGSSAWDNVITRASPTANTTQIYQPGQCPVYYKIKIEIRAAPLGNYAAYYRETALIRNVPGTLKGFNVAISGNNWILSYIAGTATNSAAAQLYGIQNLGRGSWAQPTLNYSLVQREDNQADQCGTARCRFDVADSRGNIYSRTEDQCPEYRTECGSHCPPGQEEMGDCCVNCDDYLSLVRSARSAVRSL